MPPQEQDVAVDRFGLCGSVLARKYRVDRVVAEGGFAVVYRGKHLALEAPVAIKVLKTPPELSEQARAEFVDKFLLEAKTIARMRHPSIVQVLDTGVSTIPSGEQAPWAVLEWLTGDTLEDLIAARAGAPLSAPDVFALIKPVLEALAHAHDERIAHRDVKPGNIMLVPSKRGVSVRLLDFGIAKLMDDNENAGSGATKTRSARIAYSPAYASPEQVALARTGPWTDVHAIGLILTELLSGKSPYPNGDATEIASAVMSPARPTPAYHGVNVGAWELVIARALALKPGDRFRDAGELLAALEATLPSGSSPDLTRALGSLPSFRARIGTADTISTDPNPMSGVPSSALYSAPSGNLYGPPPQPNPQPTPQPRPVATSLAVTGEPHPVAAPTRTGPIAVVVASLLAIGAILFGIAMVTRESPHAASLGAPAQRFVPGVPSAAPPAVSSDSPTPIASIPVDALPSVSAKPGTKPPPIAPPHPSVARPPPPPSGTTKRPSHDYQLE